jgi:hypothetical protein
MEEVVAIGCGRRPCAATKLPCVSALAGIGAWAGAEGQGGVRLAAALRTQGAEVELEGVGVEGGKAHGGVGHQGSEE